MKYLLFFLVLFPIIGVNADEWIVNKDHSEILFTVPYLNVSEVTGRFGDYKGSAVIDGERLQELDLSIKVSSLNTENRLRDSHLKAPDFFNTAIYPDIVFSSTTITSLGSKRYRAQGTLSLHGKSKVIDVPFELTDQLEDSWGYKNRFAKFSFRIKRSDFNLKWNKTLAENKYLVGDEVSVRGAIQLQPLHSLTPANKHFIPVTSFTRAKERLKRGEISRREFEKLYMVKTSETSAPALIPQAIVPKAKEVTKTAPVPNVDFRNSFTWWVAFGTLGLLGFFAAIIVGLFAKNTVLDLFPKRYREEGFLGNASDLLVIGFTLVYSMAFWYVGWGH